MRGRILCLTGLSLAWACKDEPNKATVVDPERGEGAEEFDPGPTTPSGDDTAEPDEPDDPEPEDDTAAIEDDTGTPTEPDPDPSGDVVCYPGELSDYTACFDLVDWSSDWGVDYLYPEPMDGSAQYRAPARYLDLSASDHATHVAPNFVFNEFMHEDKGRFGLYQVHVVEFLQSIRDITDGPLYVNSGYRNVTYNESVGGATWSRHMYGDAVDMHSGVVSLAELEGLCQDLGAGFTLLYSSHVHCDWRDDLLDEAFYDPMAAIPWWWPIN